MTGFGRIVALASAALSVVVFAAPGCKRKTDQSKQRSGGERRSVEAIREAVPRTWVLPEVRLELLASRGQELDIDSTALARRVGSALRASIFFVADERETPEGRQFASAMVVARLSYDVLDEDSAKPRAFVALELVVLPDPAGAAAEELPAKDNVIVEKPLSKAIHGAALVEVLTEQAELAIDLGVQSLLKKEAMRTDTAGELAEAVKRADDASFWALEIIGDRKAHDALDAVIGALRGDDRDLADASISVLVALGEPAAVSALTENIDFQNYERVRVIIEASAALGGEDAAEFLEFVASGHPDPTIKARAEEALAEVNARGSEPNKVPLL